MSFFSDEILETIVKHPNEALIQKRVDNKRQYLKPLTICVKKIYRLDYYDGDISKTRIRNALANPRNVE